MKPINGHRLIVNRKYEIDNHFFDLIKGLILIGAISENYK